MTICTSRFESLLRTTAKAKGFPDLSIVTVSHPIGGIDLAEVKKKADGANNDVITILTTPLEKRRVSPAS